MDTSKAEVNQRRVRRVRVRELRPELRKFVLVTESGAMFNCETFDASTLGLGLMIPALTDGPEEGDTLTVLAYDRSFSLKGEVVFVNLVNDEWRLGIQFLDECQQSKYHILLNTCY